MQQSLPEPHPPKPDEQEALSHYEPPKELCEAIRKELLALLMKPAFDVGTLLRVGEVANAAHQLLVAHSPVQKLSRRPFGSISPGMNQAYSSGASLLEGGSGLTENVGTRVMRELTSMLGQSTKKKESKVGLVRALAEARKHGLDDVAKQLEAELGMGEPEVDADKAENEPRFRETAGGGSLAPSNGATP